MPQISFIVQAYNQSNHRDIRADNTRLMNEITLMDELEELQEQQEMHMIRNHYGTRRTPRCSDESRWGY